MFAWTGQVTAGKLGTRIAWPPPTNSRERFGIDERSRARRPGIESKTTNLDIQFPIKLHSFGDKVSTVPKNVCLQSFFLGALRDFEEWPKKVMRLLRGCWAIMAVPAQLDAKETIIPNFG